MQVNIVGICPLCALLDCQLFCGKKEEEEEEETACMNKSSPDNKTNKKHAKR